MSQNCSSNGGISPGGGWIVALAAGAAIGALNLAHYLLTSYVPDSLRFGIFPGGSVLLAPMWPAGTLTPQFKAIVVLGAGIVVGSFIVSIATGKLSIKSFRESKVDKKAIRKALTGGFLMGFGLLLSEGCLIRHSLTGIPTLQLSSIVSLAGMLAGMWGGIKLLEGKK